LAVLALAVGVSVVYPTAAVAGASGGGSTPNVSVTYTVADVQFDGPDCARAAITVSYARSGTPLDQVNGSVYLKFAYQGSSDHLSASVDIDAEASDIAVTGTQIGALRFCPDDYADAGPLRVTGSLSQWASTVGGGYTIADADAPLSESSIGITQNPTSFGRLRVAKVGNHVEISGKATARTLTHGVIGADGTIQIAIRRPGAKKWIDVTDTIPDQFGRWEASLNTGVNFTFPQGTQIRARLEGCGWCTDVTQAWGPR
jgi:hypothetical protein